LESLDFPFEDGWQINRRGCSAGAHSTNAKETEMKPRYAGQGLILSVIGLLFLGPTAVAQTTHIVTVGDDFFSPSSLTINVGDTVEWRNADGGMPHNVTANDGSFASTTASSFTFSMTFNSAGTVNYQCTVHPASMTGVITVQGVAAQAELVLEEVSVAPGSYPQGSAISIDAEVRNTGNASSGAFTIRHYASTNSGINTQDVLLGTENRASLPAGENSNGPFNATIPANLAPGSYFIGSIVQFSDGNSGDNTNVAEDTINVTAVANGLQINAGMSDAWYDPTTDGQGFFVIVWEDTGLIFLSWFTFDTERPPQDVMAILGEPGHRWLTAQGPFAGDTAELDVHLTEGGVFDASVPAPDPAVQVGTITIVWTGCNSGTLTYDLPGLGLSGEIPIQRIVLDNVALCEALQGQ
jgi:plastocyanin